MSGVRALVIDDNSNNRGVLSELLELEGVACTQVDNPLALEGMLSTIETPNVVFLDLEMPGLNGYEVLRLLKSEPSYQHVPVVAYTVHVSEINTARTQGFDGFLAKPIDADQFSDQLARILHGEHVWSRA